VLTPLKWQYRTKLVIIHNGLYCHILQFKYFWKHHCVTRRMKYHEIRDISRQNLIADGHVDTFNQRHECIECICISLTWNWLQLWKTRKLTLTGNPTCHKFIMLSLFKQYFKSKCFLNHTFFRLFILTKHRAQLLRFTA